VTPAKDKICVPGRTYFPSDAERRDERPITELQGMTIEDACSREVNDLCMLCT